jgi:hypothetical protein
MPHELLETRARQAFRCNRALAASIRAATDCARRQAPASKIRKVNRYGRLPEGGGGLQSVMDYGFMLNRHRALDLWWSMILSENRCPLFRIML